MNQHEILAGKKILIVDDEADILETLEELLDSCEIETASNFQTAEEHLQSKSYDAVILDIMGVRGYDLLKIANQKKIPALMLTAHAVSPEDLKKSIKEGASSYVPKEKMIEIGTFLSEILQTKNKPEKVELMGTLGAGFIKLKPYYEMKFGKEAIDAI